MQDFLKRISLRELRLLFCGVGAIVAAAIVVLMIVPKAKELRSSVKAAEVLNQASLDGDELEQLLESKREKLEKIRYQLHGDMANLPAKQIESYVIGRLQRVSWNNSVELVSVEPATGDRVQIFQEMLFNVRLVGQYEDLYRWLWEAREDLGYVVVKEYALSRQDNADSEPLLVANLSLASYRAIE